MVHFICFGSSPAWKYSAEHSRIAGMTHSLISPSTPAEWVAYHEIRREVLWGARGRFGVYDDTHPDGHKANNFPKLFLNAGEPIGVNRIDLKGDAAWFRRVAIKEQHQRQGHGRALLTLAEEFAKERGAVRVNSNVDIDAISFYRRCGYCSLPGQAERHMYKDL